MDLPERFLKQIWQRRLFTADRLATSDGRPVAILSPGIPNDDGGPDFTGARIRIGTVTYQGDVELHRTARDWQTHGHARDPHYNRVILHVVLTDTPLTPPAQTSARRRLPLLVLHPFLDPATRPSVLAALSDEPAGGAPAPACRARSGEVPAAVITRWLEHLAWERIEMKIRRFDARLRELIDEHKQSVQEPYPRYYGNPDDIPKPHHAYTQRDAASPRLWEQLLYEGMMEGLGYAKNEAPFSALARSVPLAVLRKAGLTDATSVSALLFGAAGLLPSPGNMADRESREYVRPLRRRWRELRPLVTGPLLHEGDWKFFRLRPGNFPTVRLAAFCRILPRLFEEQAFRELVELFKVETLSVRERLRILASRFADAPDGFWLHHYRFGVAARAPVAGLGAARVADLLVNVQLPVMLLYARIFRDTGVRTGVRSLIQEMPSRQVNSVVRRIDEHLIAGRFPLSTAFLQQGALQLMRMYCLEHRCGDCEVGRRTGVARA